MNIEPVSIASIGGMAFCLIVSFGLPIGLAIYLRVRKRAKLLPLFVGGITFFVVVFILEQLFHTAVFALTGDFLKNHRIWYAVYGGFAAALFEESGRFVAMHFLMRKNAGKADALMYGVGHGGVEMIMLVGITSIINLIGAISVNNGSFAAMAGTMENGQETIAALSALWTTPSWQFYIAGIERVLAMVLQISLSVLVYHAVVSRKLRYLFIAGAFHFLVDAVTVFLASRTSLAVAEGAVAVMAAITAGYAMRVYREIG